MALQVKLGSEGTVYQAIDLHGGVLDEGEVGHSQVESVPGAEEAWTVVAFVTERLSTERERERDIKASNIGIANTLQSGTVQL